MTHVNISLVTDESTSSVKPSTTYPIVIILIMYMLVRSASLPANGLFTVSLADLFLSSIIAPPSTTPSRATLPRDCIYIHYNSQLIFINTNYILYTFLQLTMFHQEIVKFCRQIF